MTSLPSDRGSEHEAGVAGLLAGADEQAAAAAAAADTDSVTEKQKVIKTKINRKKV